MQKYCSASPSPSPVDRILSDLFTMTHPSWVDQHCITLTALSHTSPVAMTRGRGWQRMRWSDSITGSQDVKSGKLWEIVEDGGAWWTLSMGSQRVRHDLGTQQQQWRFGPWDNSKTLFGETDFHVFDITGGMSSGNLHLDANRAKRSWEMKRERNQVLVHHWATEEKSFSHV